MAELIDAGLPGIAPPDLLDPSDPSVRVALDPALALEGDEPAVLRPDEAGLEEVRMVGPGHASVRWNGSTARVLLGPADRGSDGTERREVVVDGWRFVVTVASERLVRLRERASGGRSAAAGGGRFELRAMIPGRIVAIAVAEGDVVETGQQLLIVEAMKMQNELRAPHAGTVERIEVSPGQAVELGALLLVIG